MATVKASLSDPKLAKAIAEARKLCVELPVMMNRCHSAGLYLTGHAMHETVKVIGWELAALLNGKRPKKRK